MNGATTGTSATTTTGLGGGAYSFYLNVVVLNQALTASSSSHAVDDAGAGGAGSKEDGPVSKGETQKDVAAAAPQDKKEMKREEPNLAPAAAREEAEDDAAVGAPAATGADAENKKADDEAAAGGDEGGEDNNPTSSPKSARKGLLDSMTMPASMAGMSAGLKSLSFSSHRSVSGGGTSSERGSSDKGAGSSHGVLGGMTMASMSMKGGALDKSLHNTMKAVSKRSIAISDKASRYVAGKTMIARASAALDKALPEVVKSVSQSGAGGGSKLDLTVGRRFQQGPVIVLQVDLKASGLPAYVEAVRGEDAAEHYRCALSSLRLLGAARTAAQLEREMLPLIRKGLMERMGEEVVRTMKSKDESGAPLEVECIALEEGEEARWLFTYMEFQSQMK